MISFKDDKEALEFLARFVSSDTWKWIEQVIRARHDAIFSELNNPKTTADGRAMLTGKLVESKYFLEFPVKSYQYYKGVEAMKQQAESTIMTDQQKETMVAKTAFPDIVTH